MASRCPRLDFIIKPHTHDGHLLEPPLNQGLVRLFLSKGKVQQGQHLLWPYRGSQTLEDRMSAQLDSSLCEPS